MVVKTSLFTCSNKHDIVLSVGSAHSVHGDLREAVVHISADKNGPPGHGVDGIVHKRVVPCKLDHIVRETLSGLKAAKCLTGTLMEEMEMKIIFNFSFYFQLSECVATFWEKLEFWFAPQSPSNEKSPALLHLATRGRLCSFCVTPAV